MLEEEVFGMYHQTHCRFYNDFAYDSKFEGAALSCEEGERLAKLIGKKAVLFMANHGVLFTARNAAIAFDHAYFMERACMMQVPMFSKLNLQYVLTHNRACKLLWSNLKAVFTARPK